MTTIRQILNIICYAKISKSISHGCELSPVAKQILNFSRSSVRYGELLLRHYELWFVCRASQRCRQCIRLQPATSPQERCNTSLSTRQFGNLSVEMRYVWREGWLDVTWGKSKRDRESARRWGETEEREKQGYTSWRQRSTERAEERAREGRG